MKIFKIVVIMGLPVFVAFIAITDGYELHKRFDQTPFVSASVTSLGPPALSATQTTGVSVNPEYNRKLNPEYNRKLDIKNHETVPQAENPNLLPPEKPILRRYDAQKMGFQRSNIPRTVETPVSPARSTQKIFCRFGRLTDIVVFGKAPRVVMSDPADFKIETLPDGIVSGLLYSHTMHIIHLIIKPLKGSASSDLFVIDGDHTHYLSLKTVSKGHRYATRVEIGAAEDHP